MYPVPGDANPLRDECGRNARHWPGTTRESAIYRLLRRSCWRFVHIMISFRSDMRVNRQGPRRPSKNACRMGKQRSGPRRRLAAFALHFFRSGSKNAANRNLPVDNRPKLWISGLDCCWRFGHVFLWASRRSHIPGVCSTFPWRLHHVRLASTARGLGARATFFAITL
jgi:hypothetical protein